MDVLNQLQTKVVKHSAKINGVRGNEDVTGEDGQVVTKTLQGGGGSLVTYLTNKDKTRKH